MKGMSMALETVIMLVLGSIVLGALLAFFFGVFTPSQTEAQLIQKQNNICQQIFNIDQKCGLTAYGITYEVRDTANNLITQGVCKADRASCNWGTADVGTDAQIRACIVSCCKIFCGFHG